jgi:3-oxoacyl-[acyl-carrier protein] reductase
VSSEVSFAKKLALVSGASSGIARAIAEHLLAHGWRVLGLDLAPASIAHADYQHIQQDLCDITALKDALGIFAVDAFVHAAGILRVGKLGELDLAQSEQMWRIHTHAAAGVCNVLVPTMQARRSGRIVLLGSRVSSGFPGRSMYAASKAALVAMARSWAAELAASGITVNVVSPAATQTAMLQDPSRAASPPRLPPIGRLIQADEIACLVAYLLSPPAAAITGQEITICGGSSLNQ